MIIETINETVRASQFVGHEKVIEQVEGDIIVPDIKPDILSMVKVTGNVYITKKEIQDGKLRLEGIVDICAIYIADDETNSIKSINANLNFNESVDIQDARVGMVPVVSYNLGNIEYKILNGRKLNVKCPIEFNIKVLENKNIEMIKELSNNNSNIQVLNKNLKFNSLVASETDNVSIKENVSLPENILPMREIVKSSIMIVNKDYKVSYNKLLAKADAKVRVIYIADDEAGNIQTFETIIPITGFLDMPGINDNMNIEVDYDVCSFYVRPIYQDLKITGIYIEANVLVTARAYENKEVMIIEDLYNPDNEIKYNTKNISINQSMVNRSEIINLNQTLSIPELDNSRVLDVSIMPMITEKKVLDDKIIVDGNVELDILYYKLDKRVVESKKIDIPFEQVINIKSPKNVNIDDIGITVTNIDYMMQGNGGLQLNLTMELYFNVRDKINFDVISDINQTEECLDPVASVVIYYVKPNDSLWKIAKRYRTTTTTIMQVNNLKDDKIYPGDQLLIPKKMYKVVLDPLN